MTRGIVMEGNSDFEEKKSRQIQDAKQKGHCSENPYPFRLDTSCFEPPQRQHPSKGTKLYNSWADPESVQNLALRAWRLINGFMENSYVERWVPTSKYTLIRITKVLCGYCVERFECKPAEDGWPIYLMSGGFYLQGPCKGSDDPGAFSISPVKPGSLRPLNTYEEIYEQLLGGVQVVRSMQHVVHITHGHHQLELEKGKYPDTGGQNEFINKAAEVLARLGARSTIFNRGGYLAGPKDPHSGFEFTHDLTVGVIRVEDAMSPKFERKEDQAPFTDALAYDMALWIGREHVDVLMAHYWDALVEAAYVRRFLGADIPIIFVPHSLGEHKRRNEEKKRGTSDFDQQKFDGLNLEERIKLEQKMLDEEVDLVASTSQELTDILIEFYNYPSKRIFTLTPGYDDDLYKPTTKASCWLHDDPAWENFGREILRLGNFPANKDLHWLKHEAFFITEISRTDRTKNKDVILKAVAEVSRRHPNVVLLINIADPGRSELGKELYQLLDQLRKNYPNMLVAPFAAPSDDFVLKMHMVAELYVTMSNQEGFGMSVLNAAACAKPAIFTNCVPFGVEDLLGKIREGLNSARHVVLGEAGVMVPLGNSGALCEAICYMYNDRDLRKKMGEKAHQCALPYSWTKSVEKFLESIGCLTPEGKVNFANLKQFPRRNQPLH